MYSLWGWGRVERSAGEGEGEVTANFNRKKSLWVNLENNAKKIIYYCNSIV